MFIFNPKRLFVLEIAYLGLKGIKFPLETLKINFKSIESDNRTRRAGKSIISNSTSIFFNRIHL